MIGLAVRTKSLTILQIPIHETLYKRKVNELRTKALIQIITMQRKTSNRTRPGPTMHQQWKWLRSLCLCSILLGLLRKNTGTLYLIQFILHLEYLLPIF